MLAIAEPDRDDLFLTTQQLADRWVMDPASLANLRNRGEGIPYVKLPSGAVRYRLVDICAAEKAGLNKAGAPLIAISWNRLRNAMKNCPELDGVDVERAFEAIRSELSSFNGPPPADLTRLVSST